jgi:hypothetical protein
LNAAGLLNLEQLRQYFIARLGAVRGQARFEQFVKFIAATSVRTKPPANIRIGSYYDYRAGIGEPLTSSSGRPEYPFGHPQVKWHKRNSERIVTGVGFSSIYQPKVSSFEQNLIGNLAPYMIDSNISRLLELINSKGNPLYGPLPQHYGYLEDLLRSEAQRLGVAPAIHHSALFVGGSKELRNPLIQVIEERVGLKAKELGVPKSVVLRLFADGKIPLRSLIPVAVLAGWARKNLFTPPTTDADEHESSL